MAVIPVFYNGKKGLLFSRTSAFYGFFTGICLLAAKRDTVDLLINFVISSNPSSAAGRHSSTVTSPVKVGS